MEIKDLDETIMTMQKRIAKLEKEKAPARWLTKKEVRKLLGNISDSTLYKYQVNKLVVNRNPFGRPMFNNEEIASLINGGLVNV